MAFPASPILKKVYQEIANELDIPLSLVEKVVNSQFKFVKDVMANGEKNRPDTFKTIQLTHMGKFAVRKSKVEYYKRKVEMSVPDGMEFNKNYPLKDV